MHSFHSKLLEALRLSTTADSLIPTGLSSSPDNDALTKLNRINNGYLVCRLVSKFAEDRRDLVSGRLSHRCAFESLLATIKPLTGSLRVHELNNSTMLA